MMTSASRIFSLLFVLLGLTLTVVNVSALPAPGFTKLDTQSQRGFKGYLLPNTYKSLPQGIKFPADYFLWLSVKDPLSKTVTPDSGALSIYMDKGELEELDAAPHTKLGVADLSEDNELYKTAKEENQVIRLVSPPYILIPKKRADELNIGEYPGSKSSSSSMKSKLKGFLPGQH